MKATKSIQRTSIDACLAPPREVINQSRADCVGLAELLEGVIQIREQQRDVSIMALRRDMDRLIDQLRRKTHQLLLEELACYKDILALRAEGDTEEQATSSPK